MSFTIATALTWAEQQLAGSSSPRLDAQVLLAYCLAKPRVYLKTWPEQTLTEQQDAQFRVLVAQRIQGQPIAYLTKTREFWSLNLAVSPATLIPRPDTEVLVEQALARMQRTDARCLDLGTGTGAIALALASEQPSWQVTGVDKQTEAVALAQFNANNLGLTHVKFLTSDWFSAIAGQQFELIVSNPPYIDGEDPHLAQGDVQFEPKSALVAEQQGLADIIHIVQQARAFLVNNGLLIIEHGYQQGLVVQTIFRENGYHQIETIQDYGDNDRITLGYFKHDAT